MSAADDMTNNRPPFPGEKECGTCLFVDQGDDGRENCLRFARFVDHALHGASRGCDYWTPQSEQ